MVVEGAGLSTAGMLRGLEPLTHCLQKVRSYVFTRKPPVVVGHGILWVEAYGLVVVLYRLLVLA